MYTDIFEYFVCRIVLCLIRQDQLFAADVSQRRRKVRDVDFGIRDYVKLSVFCLVRA